MKQVRDVMVLVTVLVALACEAAVAQPGARPGLGECDASLEATPGAEAGYRCLFEAAQSAPGGVARGRLEILASEQPTVGWPLFYLGLVHWSEPPIAERWLDRAARVFEEAGDTRGELLARGNRANLLFLMGEIGSAGGEAAIAARLGEDSGDDELFARGKIYLARHMLRTGSSLERSFHLLDEVAARLSPESPPHLAYHCLVNLGNVSMALGRLADAEAAFRQLLELSLRTGDPYSEAEALYGLTRLALEDFFDVPTAELRADALALASRTVDASQRGEHAFMEAMAHWVLGVFAAPESRQSHLERCVEVAPTQRERAYCVSALARQLIATDPAAAERVLEQALSLAEEAGDPWSQVFVWSEHMRVSWAAESLDRAVTDSWKALDTIETLRDLQEEGSEVQAGLFSNWADEYHFFGGRLLEEARLTGRSDLVTEAFAVSERLRARALTDWLQATGQELAGSGPSGFASLLRAQRALGPQEALLVFQVAPWEDPSGDFGGGSWVIAVTRWSARAYPLPGRNELRRAVDLYTGLFEGRDGAEAAPSSALFEQLLAPALAELPAGVDRLILVPDDALHRLPFGALRPAPDAPPLADTHRLSVAPSATLWLGWRRGEAAGRVLQASAEDADRAPALVLAAPTTPVGAGGAAAAKDGGARDLLAPDLPPLRHARREGRSVVAALGRGTELAMGARAAENLLARPDLGRFGVLHLAAHAVTDEDHPERSAVVLAPAAAGDLAAADGLLQAGEIASLDLGGKLVVLSSCRSAAGTVLRGEGVMSLGRAFFQAGARTVVASLWPVRDDEAAALFETFYRHLARGETVAAALQAAQAERRAAGAPASAWAAFVVLGDGDLAPVLPAPRPDPGLRLALIAAGILAALLLALAVVALRHRLATALAAPRPRNQDLSDLAPSSPSAR